VPINNPTPQPGVVRPRPRVVVAGQPLPGCYGVSITSTNNYTGDTFHATFAPPVGFSGTGGVAWWASQDQVKVDVQIGMLPMGAPEYRAAWTSMLTGLVDQIDVDWIGGTVSIAGRDNTAVMRDSPPGAYSQNQTSSEVVTDLANLCGLTPMVTPTTTLVGRYYEIDHGSATGLGAAHHVANIWDAVVELARFEGFDAFVSGTSLYFQPPVAATADPWLVYSILDPATGVLRANVTGLQMTHALHIAKGVKVTVKSWHSRNNHAAVVTVGSTAATAQAYNIVRPGLTPDQATTFANRYLAELTRHERTISGSVPGDLLLTPRVMMRLDGTGTGFDQTYYPVEIVRHIGDGGFTMDFTAKNQSPQVLASAGAPTGG
jgi:hypothetical protein